MAFEFQDRDTDAYYTGKELEFVIDDEQDVGEVYLDGDLIFQADEVYDEGTLRTMFKEQFEVIVAEPESEESDVIEEDDEDEYNDRDDYDDVNPDDPGLQEGLYTVGGEFASEDMREYIGDYHIHPKKGPMEGKYHTSRAHGMLVPLTFEQVAEIREIGEDPKVKFDYDLRVEDYDDIDGDL